MIKKTLHPKISYQKPTRDNNKNICSTCLSFFCHVSTIEKRTLHNICIEVNFNFFLLATHWWSFCCEMHQILQTRNNILRTFQLFRYWRSFFDQLSNCTKSYLFASVMHHSLRVFEHFLSPKLEKVSRISVEFQAVLAILAVRRLQNYITIWLGATKNCVVTIKPERK